jgi:histidinol-phosphatase (PHP family)
MKASYHNHTPRCGHATGTEEEYVLHAIKNKYDIFGFSDHAPHTFVDLLYTSRMAPEELDFYVSDILALRKKYSSYIDLKIGLELEYYPKTHARDMALYRKAGVEYLILGQHAIGDGTPKMHTNSFRENFTEADYTAYVNQCIEGLNTGHFSYFAHPDVFNYRRNLDFFLEESERLIKAAVAVRVPLELNLYGLSEMRHYPYSPFWELVGKIGAPVALGRDAHSTERVHSEREMADAYRFAEKHKLNVIDTVELRGLG